MLYSLWPQGEERLALWEELKNFAPSAPAESTPSADGQEQLSAGDNDGATDEINPKVADLMVTESS